MRGPVIAQMRCQCDGQRRSAPTALTDLREGAGLRRTQLEWAPQAMGRGNLASGAGVLPLSAIPVRKVEPYVTKY
jgi:hypothetical protein